MSKPAQLPIPHAQVMPIRSSGVGLPGPAPQQIPPPVSAARFRKRHALLLISFVVLVLVPVAFSGWYLYTKAAAQFASSFGFAVRSQDTPTGLDIIGGMSGLAALSGNPSSDSDILFEFLQSTALVRRLNDRLNLKQMWSRPENDPVFTYDPSGSIEDLSRYWPRMVHVFYDPGTRLTSVRVHAFTPDDALSIATALLAQSSEMINRLSNVAHADATRHASDELELAKNRLSQARQDLTTFRSTNQVVDPMADLAVEMGVFNQLQQQLAQELVALDMLRSTLSNRQNTTDRQATISDVKITQAQRRVTVIRHRIAEERQKFGAQGLNGTGEYSTQLADFERMSVDLEFAEQAYISALSTFEITRATAARQSRYLAVYAQPELAERVLYPKRAIALLAIAALTGLGWAVIALISLSVGDRR